MVGLATLVGRHADGQVDGARRFTFDGSVCAYLHGDFAAPHALDRRAIFATAAVEQCQRMARLHPQHLDVAGSTGWQRQRAVRGQRHGAVKARRHTRP